jgi:hypothetical protein
MGSGKMPKPLFGFNPRRTSFVEMAIHRPEPQHYQSLFAKRKFDLLPTALSAGRQSMAET